MRSLLKPKTHSLIRHASSLTTHRIGQPHPRTHPHILQPDEINYGLSKGEFATRRYNLLQKLPINSVVIIPSARHIYMTNDIPYRYKANVDFLYLSGFHEPSSAIVLTKDAHGNAKYILFCRERKPEKELWDGPMVGVERAGEFFGADEVHSIDDLGGVLGRMNLKQRRVYLHDIESEFTIGTAIYTCLQDTTHENVKALIENLRLVKSEPEQDIMREACRISGESFAKAMGQTRHMKSETHMNAYFEFECAKRGCKRPAYPPVVAAGVSATTLHYINNDNVLQSGDLILMDAGGEFHDYVADITRTWPINEKFTEPQKELYNAVLDIQSHCLKYCTPGSSLELIYKEGVAKTIKTLKELGLPQYANYDRFNIIFPHDTGHYLGMDVHDTPSVPKSKRLQPGVVVTVEPGLYFSDDESIPKRFRNLGIRIEDDVLITSKGYEILTTSAPKTIEEVEAACRAGGAITMVE